MKTENKRKNYFRELAGLRVVAMYVQEFFHWGWQQLDQENDDGIDGYVIIRDRVGKDMGCNIRVQVKSGPSYFSSRPNRGKHVNISPYASAESLASHMRDYHKSLQPVILVWVNTQKERSDGTFYEDIMNPEAWWERVDNYTYEGGTVITLTHKFGEHSKGDWFSMVEPMLKNWEHYMKIEMNEKDKRLYNSIDLKKDARIFYEGWKKRRTYLTLSDGKVFEIKKTRTGWRHINYYGRGRTRTFNSLRLLSIAERIIQDQNVFPVILNEEQSSINGLIIKIGLRARVQIDTTTQLKVQVVLLRKTNQVKGIDEIRFFSVHIIK